MVQDDIEPVEVPTVEALLKEQADVVRLASDLRAMLLEANFGQMFADEMARRYVIRLLNLESGE